MGENGFLEEAADGYESLYKIYRNTKGQFHEKTMWALSRAAIVFRLFKQYDHALELLETLYDTVTDPRLSHVKDRNLKSTIWILRQMSEILTIIGKYREAKEKLEQIRFLEQVE